MYKGNGRNMTYYDTVKLLQANGWTSVKMYKNRETWAKGNVTVTLIVQDRISKALVNSIIASA